MTTQPPDSQTTALSISARGAFPWHPSAWAGWWRELSGAQRWLPLTGVAVYWAALHALGGFRDDHLKMGILILLLCYGGRWARVVFNFLLPLILTGIIYDSMRFYSDYIRGPIHVTEPYDFDKRFFGVITSQGFVLTPNEWWQLHTTTTLDFFTGLAYLVFIGVYVITAGYFHFWLAPRRPEMRGRTPRVMWSFFWVNMLGYSTYYWYAAAPPWYVAKYGLGPAQTDVQASSAGCVRFDQLMGTHFFSDFYGKAADVFGAIPSLHVAYPLLTFLFALRFRSLRVFALGFYLLMCFSAVYLNHHYVLDILWGSSYAVLIYWVMNWIGERRMAA
jgi:hypothetical protein